METKRININGIVRNKARNEFADGDCQEIINMRYRDNAWRAIPDPDAIKSGAFDNDYKAVWLHVQDNVRNYIALDNDGRLVLLNSTTWEETLIKDYETTEIAVKFLKRFMLVITATGIDKWIWKSLEQVYFLGNISNAPDLTLKAPTNALFSRTETATNAESLLGKYRKLLIEINQQDGVLEGALMYRLAYKLFDGSYVLHTLPTYLMINYLGGTIEKVTGQYRIRVRTSYIYAEINRPYYTAFAGMKDVISSICIFVCKNERLHTVDETTITDSVLAGVTTSKTFSDIPLPINNDFKKMADAKSWYKIHEIAFTQAIDPNIGETEVIDMKGFVRDYAARETLPVDSFSHHRLTGSVDHIYNDRLILCDTKTILGDYYLWTDYVLIGWNGYAHDSFRESYTLVSLVTDNGVIYKLTPLVASYSTKNGKLYLIFSQPVIGYPDARATEMKVLTKHLDQWYITAEFALKKSLNDNYAYYHANDFDATQPVSPDFNYNKIIKEIKFEGDKIVNIDDYVSRQIVDNNRVQLSELRNPYYFPAKNSYQVGTGTILAVGANTEPLSTGQFGQYPLSVFTSKGIWAMEQGQGEVIFAAISPVSGDVILNKNQVISVGNGVVFTTKRGVFAISGKQVAQLSEPLEGYVNQDFTDNAQFQFSINQTTLVQLLNNISEIDALSYIAGAKVGFDKINSELYFSNPDADYSYVFNFESKSWHKVSRSYELFVNDYPNLLAINQNGLFDLGLQSSATSKSVLILSQPQPFGLPEMFKKMERLALRCTISCGSAKYFTLAVYASNDLKTWQLITGGQRTGDITNILLTRSHGSAKYYIFQLSGNVSLDSNISGVEVTVAPRLEKKLRK